jgi:hypothetical protein
LTGASNFSLIVAGKALTNGAAAADVAVFGVDDASLGT